VQEVIDQQTDPWGIKVCAPCRQAGKSVREATAMLQGASVADKNALLFQHGINFNTLPTWQRRGTGLYWEDYIKEGFNPKKQHTIRTTRHRLKIALGLLRKDDYGQLIRRIMHNTLKVPRQAERNTRERGDRDLE
jgi:tRNA(His) guanylyltransferase